MKERMKEVVLFLGLVSGAFGFLAGLALMKGSSVVPWSIQSWSGESEAEKAFCKKTKRWNLAGLIGLTVAFALSVVSAIANYYS
jgi:hypothetical protein